MHAQRANKPLHRAAEIRQAVSALICRRKMAKHFAQIINKDGFRFTRNGQAGAWEAKLNGIDLLRTGLFAEQSNTAVTVLAYKGLAWAEHAFARNALPIDRFRTTQGIPARTEFDAGGPLSHHRRAAAAATIPCA